ncbi:MAG TPA: Nif11 family protein [Negativicutes bacterium]|nr:Nif11 family protein [Negativicutes bacterium]
MSRIQSIAIKDDYRLEALLDNGSSITLNMQSRLGTVRFGLLFDPAFFATATTDGSFIRWGDQIEISLTELFQLAQQSHHSETQLLLFSSEKKERCNRKYNRGGIPMSTENVQKFYAAISQDEALKQKFAELSRKYAEESLDDVTVRAMIEQETLSLAAQLGYSFTVDDLKEYGEEMQSPNGGYELSDDELEAVTGGGNTCDKVGFGWGTWTQKEGNYARDYTCVIAGFGESRYNVSW